jgi:hypothetical protein
MRRNRPGIAWAVAMALPLVVGWAGVAGTQPHSPDGVQMGGIVDVAREAARQEYALRLRDAEAKLRAAHERMAGGGAGSPQPRATSPAQEDLTGAAQDALDAIRSAPPGFADTEAYRAADRRFEEWLRRQRADGTPPRATAEAAREMLQALAALREIVGAPAAPPATHTPGGTPAEPAAQGGERS